MIRRGPRRWAWRRRHNEDGYALATVVALTFVLIMTITAVFTVSLSNIEGSRRAAGQLAGRNGAENAVDAVFNEMLTVSGAPTSLSDLLPAGVEADAVAGPWKWFAQNSKTGKWSICTAPTDTCQHFAISPDPATAPNANDFTVEVATRSRCLGATLDTTNGGVSGGKCIVTKYQQRIRKKQYFDYLSFTEQETLPVGPFGAPAGTYAPYSGTNAANVDIIDGPVRTDGQFAICSGDTLAGSNALGPRFLSTVESVSATFRNGGTGCGTIAYRPGATTGSYQQLAAPTQVAKLGLPAGTGIPKLCEVAKSGGTTWSGLGGAVAACPTGNVAGSGFVRIVLGTTGYSVCSSSTTIATDPIGLYPLALGCTALVAQNYPANGVLFIDAKALFLGGTLKADQKLTIATSGNLRIRGDVKYETYNSTTKSATGKEALGLVAGGNVAVLCKGDVNTTASGMATVDQVDTTISSTPSTVQTCGYDGQASLAGATDPGAKRIVNAAILALGNGGGQSFIFADNWATSGYRPWYAWNMGGIYKLPTLEFYGSMASSYRAPFGAFSNGAYVRGFQKDFKYDSRLKNTQPPYFLEPTNTQWERVDLTEVPPCSAGLGGVTPSGAGC